MTLPSASGGANARIFHSCRRRKRCGCWPSRSSSTLCSEPLSTVLTLYRSRTRAIAKSSTTSSPTIMIVGLEVVDDFAIARVRLPHKVSTVDNGSEQSVELDLEGQQPQRLRRRHEWKIRAFAPP